MRYLMLLAFSVYAVSVSAGQEHGGPVRRPQNDAETLEYLKKELSFSEWRSTTKDGLRIQVFDPKRVVLFPQDLLLKLYRDDPGERLYEVECTRRVPEGREQRFHVQVRTYPSLEAAHEALLTDLINSSAPIEYLKAQRDRKLSYGDVHVGPGLWARGNLVFRSSGGSWDANLAEEVFGFIDEGLTSWELRMQDLERQYAFQQWAGQVRVPEMEVRTLSLAAPDFEGFLRASVVSSGSGAAHVRLVPQAGPPMDLSIVVCDSPLSAQKRLIRGLECGDSGAPDVVRAERGSGYDIGDACFYPPSRLSIDFARNNVLVTVRGAAGNDPAELLRLARAVDAKVVKSLVKVSADSGAYGIQVDLPTEAAKSGPEALQKPPEAPPLPQRADAKPEPAAEPQPKPDQPPAPAG